MDALPSFIVHALELPPLLKYGAITLIAMFEGPVVFTVAGFLLRLHTEFLLPAFIVLGNFLGDTLWYCLGYFYAGKAIRAHGSFVGITAERMQAAERIFQQYQGRLLFFSKATLGFGTSVGIPAILMTAGMSKVSFRKYMTYNLLGEVLLLGLFMTVGYAFGISFQAVSKDLRWLTVLSLVVLFACGLTLIRSYVAKKNFMFSRD